MAARITQSTQTLLSGLFTFVGEGFKYNIQILPDTLFAAVLLFTLLLQSGQFAALGGTLFGLNLLHPVLARFLSGVLPGLVGAKSDVSKCAGRFPGISFENVLGRATSGTFGELDYAGWPSYYSMFLGCLAAYLSAMPVLYRKEADASPNRNAAMLAGLVVMALLIVLCGTYRVYSGCESLGGLLVGLVAGALVGGLAVMALAWASNREYTNLLQFPLIRDCAADGKPIYVCARSSTVQTALQGGA
jgi:hypothetical protein